MAVEKRSLFKQGDKPQRSTICKGRRISFFSGRVFNAIFGIRHDPNSYDRILGRVIDLQPIIEDVRITGIRILFRLCDYGRDESVIQHRDRRVHNRIFGPFDTVVQVTSTMKIDDPNTDEDPTFIPMGEGQNKYSMILNDRAPGQEDRFMKITFNIES